MKHRVLPLMGCLLLAGAIGAPSDPGVPPPASPAIVPRKTVEHDGQVFALANTSAGPNVETDEYTAAGETLENWTQLVTVQRLSASAVVTLDDFVRYFQRRIADDGATLEVLHRGPGSAVFVVRFPRSERNDEQVMLCLALPEPGQPSRLTIVQYAIKPTVSPAGSVETRLKSWRDTLLRQSEAIAARPTS